MTFYPRDPGTARAFVIRDVLFIIPRARFVFAGHNYLHVFVVGYMRSTAHGSRGNI